MNGWEWIVWLGAWIGAIAAAMAGIMIGGWALLGRRRSPRVEARIGKPCASAHCDCCGYELQGLEHGLCPECGWAYVDNRRIPLRKRLRTAAVGAAALAVAAALAGAPSVARYGWASITPTWALGLALPYVAETPDGVHAELRARIDSDRVNPAQRDWLAARCAAALSAPADPSAREGATGLLARLGHEAGRAQSVCSSLLAAAHDASPITRARAAEAIAAAVGAGAADHDTRAAMLRSLLSAAADDKHELVRRAAVDGLSRTLSMRSIGHHAHAAAIDVLVRAMNDPSPKVRGRALCALYAGTAASAAEASTGSPLAAIAAAATGDQHELIRETAVGVLSGLGTRFDRAVTVLGAALRDASPAVRLAAANGLLALGGKAAPMWAELMLTLDDEDAAVREAAMEAVRGLGDPAWSGLAS